MENSVVNELRPTNQQLVRLAARADLPQIAHIARVTWEATYKKRLPRKIAVNF